MSDRSNSSRTGDAVLDHMQNAAASVGVTFLDLVVAVVERWRNIFGWALLCGLGGLASALLLTPKYTSRAYLELGVGGLGQVEVLMRSPRVLDRVLAVHPNAGATIEKQREKLNQNFRLQFAPFADPKTQSLVVLEAIGKTAAQAQSLATSLIEIWMETTKPRPEQKKILEEQLERSEKQLDEIGKLIARLGTEAKTLVMPGLNNELATSLVGLQQLRLTYETSVTKLKRDLLGANRDLLVVPPGLPSEQDGPNPVLMTVSSVLLAFLVSTIFVLLSALLRSPELVHARARLREDWSGSLERTRASL